LKSGARMVANFTDKLSSGMTKHEYLMTDE